MLRMEDKIRRLCLDLLATTGDEEVGPILSELREALHQHVKMLRERASAYHILRRAAGPKRHFTTEQTEPGNRDQANQPDRDGYLSLRIT